MAKRKNHTNETTEGVCCDAIMHEVACREEKTLIRTLFIIGPAIILVTWLILVTVHLAMMQFASENASLLSQLQEEKKAFTEQAMVLMQLFWLQMRNDILILLLLSAAALGVIIIKTKVLSFPFRFKEIKKYKKSSDLTVIRH